jgi:uncharacterized protein (DUF433 family)
MTSTLPHLLRDPKGVLWLDDSGYRVIDLVSEHLAHGWGAEVLQENHPDLSLAQIHAALAWFYDHEKQMLREIDLREKRATKMLAEIGESTLQKRLGAIKAAQH